MKGYLSNIWNVEFHRIMPVMDEKGYLYIKKRGIIFRLSLTVGDEGMELYAPSPRKR